MANTKQMSETFRVGATLALAGGFLDAFTYLCHGAVFANAQTGNIVMLGVRLSEGNFRGVLTYTFPVLAFIVGILLTEIIRRWCQDWQWIHWRQPLLLLEMLVLMGCLFANRDECSPAVNVAVSFVCALQVQAFRKVHGNALATTMCTGNLRSAVEAFWNWSLHRDPGALRRSKQTFGIVGFFVLGAAIGGLATTQLPAGHEGLTLLFPIACLVAVFILLFRRGK